MPGRDPDLSIPEWYTNAQNELGRRSGSPKRADNGELDDSHSS